MTASRRVRRRRRSVVVLAGADDAADIPARALAESLEKLGVRTTYLGREERPNRIAAIVVEQHADSVELCLAGAPGLRLLRGLLRELTEVGRRDVSIVVHRSL